MERAQAHSDRVRTKLDKINVRADCVLGLPGGI